jgi:hypothetical protein
MKLYSWYEYTCLKLLSLCIYQVLDDDFCVDLTKSENKAVLLAWAGHGLPAGHGFCTKSYFVDLMRCMLVLCLWHVLMNTWGYIHDYNMNY